MSNKTKYWILVSVSLVSVLSQGMLLPLISIIFEQKGVSSSLSGWHATALYIGVLLASPFMEKPLRRIGYQRLILAGGLIVAICLSIFPLWYSLTFWFILRLIVGIGDHMLHFAIQTWLSDFIPAAKRGRSFSIYGLFCGIGFAIGPFLTNLIKIDVRLPFFVATGISLCLWALMFLVKNEFPQDDGQSTSFFATLKRFSNVWRIGWVAFLPPFGYGFLEATLNGSFPIQSLRLGFDIKTTSFLLSGFAIGTIVFQLPLGMLSDKLGRQKTLLIAFIIGIIAFSSATLSEATLFIYACLFIGGMFVGSLFSLGISFMADLLPSELLPAGNLMCGIAYSLGCIAGPVLGGYILTVANNGIYYLLSGMLLLLFIGTVFYRPQSKSASLQQVS